MAFVSKPSKGNSGAADKVVRQSSPRGLIENVNTIRQWTRPEQGPQLRETLADLKPQLVTRDLRFWLDFASAIIEASGKNPNDYRVLAESETLDHVCAAARLMKQLDKVEASIRLAQRFPEQLGLALHDALLLSSFVHQLTVVDNEPALKTGEIHAEILRRKANERTDAANRNRAPVLTQIERLLAEPRDWGNSEIARAVPEKARRGYKFDTIRKMVAKVRKKSWHPSSAMPAGQPHHSRSITPRDDNGPDSSLRPTKPRGSNRQR
jgi:hypothetical protein